MSKPEGTCQYVQKSRFDPMSAVVCMRQAQANGFCARHDPVELAKEQARVKKQKQIAALQEKLATTQLALGKAAVAVALEDNAESNAQYDDLLAKAVTLTKRLRKLTKS